MFISFLRMQYLPGRFLREELYGPPSAGPWKAGPVPVIKHCTAGPVPASGRGLALSYPAAWLQSWRRLEQGQEGALFSLQLHSFST